MLYLICMTSSPPPPLKKRSHGSATEVGLELVWIRFGGVNGVCPTFISSVSIPNHHVHKQCLRLLSSDMTQTHTNLPPLILDAYTSTAAYVYTSHSR